jgi:mono/diheme cytochrome c family protein
VHVKTALKVIGAILLVVVVLVGGTLAWAFAAADDKREAHRFDEVKGKDLPVPWPLSEKEIEDLRAEKLAAMTMPAQGEALPGSEPPPDPLAGVDLQAIAMERALTRGKHLLDARLGCGDCHASDFSGSTVIDVPIMGRWVCPNVTPGGTVKGWMSADFDRVIRHGVGHDGRGLTMPSRDYSMLSDQEVSDVIAVLQSLPPVEKVQPPIKLGPVYAMLIATGKVPIDAENIDHSAPRLAVPPTAAPTAEYGQHLTQVCVGCHQADLAGGPITGGDPSWPPARNLTPDPTGLQDWTLDDFERALREGKRKDGSPIDPSMPYAMTKNMTDDEIAAIYEYLRTVPPKPWPGKG